MILFGHLSTKLVERKIDTGRKSKGELGDSLTRRDIEAKQKHVSSIQTITFH